jgi:divalent metal cation (Fe/Co/Zn/Cd) transporter
MKFTNGNSEKKAIALSSVEDVHEILTEMESHLHKKFHQIRKITIHAEPE